MIGGVGRVKVDCVRLVLHQAVTTSLSVSGLVTFVGLQRVEMGQKHTPEGRGLR